MSPQSSSYSRSQVYSAYCHPMAVPVQETQRPVVRPESPPMTSRLPSRPQSRHPIAGSSRSVRATGPTLPPLASGKSQAALTPPAPRPMMAPVMRPRKRPGRQPRSRQVLLAGGSVVALAVMVITPQSLSNPSEGAAECQTHVDKESRLSRVELSELLKVEAQSPKADVHAILNKPYCTLTPVRGESGKLAHREAYPLEFDLKTWLVVQYEEDKYAGFSFEFR